MRAARSGRIAESCNPARGNVMHERPENVRWIVALRRDDACKIVLYAAIKNGNVYLHYLDRTGTEVGHVSQHVSGQRHFRRANGEYVKWTGGVTGEWEPMKLQRTPPAQVTERDEIGAFGFGFAELLNLPDCPDNQANVVLCELPSNCQPEMLVFQVSIVGPAAVARGMANGNFPVVWRARLGNGIAVEVEAIAVNQPQAVEQ